MLPVTASHSRVPDVKSLYEPAWNAERTGEKFLGGTLLADRAMTRLDAP